MDNLLKLPAQQATFNASNKLVDIVIPGSSGVYDMSQTYVSINMSVSGIALNTTGTDGRLPQGSGYIQESAAIADVRLALQHNASVPTIYDTCAVPIETLVRNCSLFSSTRGKIEDIRRSDALRGSMKSYTRDVGDVEDDAIGGMPGMAKTNPWASGRMATLVGVGDVASEYRPHEIRIYLRDIFNIAQAEAMDTSVYGDLRIHLELNLDRVKLLQALGSDTGNDDVTLWNRYYHNSSGGTPSQPANVLYKTAKVVVASTSEPTSQTSITMEAPYQSLEDSPFFVNQLVSVNTTYGGGGSSAGTDYPTAGENKWAVISGISWDKMTKLVTLEFTANVLQVGTATGVYEITRTVEGLDATGTSLATAISYDSIELTAVKRSDVANPPSQIQYTQYMTQSDQWTNQGTLSRTYYLPAQTTNAVIVLPSSRPDQNPSEFSDLLGCARLADYRFTVNGVSVTNRAVPFMPVADPTAAANDQKCDSGSSLHYDMVSRTFQNMGDRFHSLAEAVYDQNIPVSTPRPAAGDGTEGWLSLKSCPEKRVYALMLPVEISNDQTQLTIEFNGFFPQSSGQLHIYSQVRSVV